MNISQELEVIEVEEDIVVFVERHIRLETIAAFFV